RPLVGGVRAAGVLRVPSADVDPILRPPRLHPERAAGPALAGEAVTHRDPHGIALRRHPELAAAACSLASLHALILRDGCARTGVARALGWSAARRRGRSATAPSGHGS